MIECRNLTFGYKKALFPPVTIEISTGKLVLLIGANGIGKSTFMKTLAGLMSPIGGSVFLAGKDIHGIGEKMRARELAFVHSRPEFVPSLTALEVISLAQPSPDIAKSTELGVQYRIEHLLHVPLDRMSDGERQKVMLVRAVAQETPIILMDEPTAFLDYPSKKAWWTELLLLVQDGKTIFMSTHDIPLVPLHHPLVEALCFHPSKDNIEHLRRVSSGELEVFFGQ